MSIRVIYLWMGFMVCGAFAAAPRPGASENPAAGSTATPTPQPLASSLVRVNCTSQPYDFLRPWAKKNPSTRRGLGAVVGENMVLVTADLVANETYVEFERPAGGERAPAKVLARDYDANLALLAGEEPAFLAGANPLPLDLDARVGDRADILQLEPTGIVADTSARISTISVGPYSAEDVSLLVFRLSAPIQQREGSFVLPAVRGGKLLGLLMRYDSRNQTADVIPAQIIRRFLDEVGAGQLASAFPRAGIGYASLVDPQFRRYLGMEANGGVYVTKTAKGGAAEKAGLLPGDVILELAGRTIDADGNFNHPIFGRLPLGYLITVDSKAGDEIPLKILRDGVEKELRMTLVPRDRESSTVPLYLHDRAPAFLIAGGLVFQELSRPYLYEWGPDWRNNAPQRLVFWDAFQDELAQPGERVVILSQVLPTGATLGYEQISNVIVDSVDGKPVRSLADLQRIFSEPGGDFHRIEISDDPRVLFLSRTEIGGANRKLREQYGLPLEGGID